MCFLNFKRWTIAGSRLNNQWLVHGKGVLLLLLVLEQVLMVVGVIVVVSEKEISPMRCTYLPSVIP